MTGKKIRNYLSDCPMKIIFPYTPICYFNKQYSRHFVDSKQQAYYNALKGIS